MNAITLVGRVGRQPELVETPNGMKVAKLSLAVDRGRRGPNGDKVVDWFVVKFFGRSAEVAAKYATTGRLLAVAGAMRNDRWTDRQNIPRDGWTVIGERFEMLGPSGTGTDDAEDTSSSRVPVDLDIEDVPV